MLDPSLPWLASGYRNFKREDFFRPHSAMDSAQYRYLETGSSDPELHPSTPAGRQGRRVRSATHVRVHSSAVKHRFSRPRSARATSSHRSERVGCYNYSPEDTARLSALMNRRPKSATAVLLKHRPSSAQNKSVTQVERLHHQEQVIRRYMEDTGDEVQHSCPFCPVECRPASSSSHRPTSSTGLLAAHLPSHQDRKNNWNRPKTAPTTRRELSQLPRHNNVRRGHIAYYTNFVSKLPLHARECTPSPPIPRRRRAFQEDSAPPPMVKFEDASAGEEEEEEEEVDDNPVEDELDFGEDDVAEPVEPTPIPTPSPVVKTTPTPEPPGETREAWSPTSIAPTPTPIESRRNSVEEPVPPLVPEKPPSPLPPKSPVPPKSPSPRPSPPASPPPRKSPSPPPKPETPPPPQPPSRPKECAHKPKVPIPPLPKVKKEVRIQEPPKEKPKVPEKKEKKPIETEKKVVQKPPEEPPKPTPPKPALKKTPSQPEVVIAPPLKPEPAPEPESELKPEPQPQEEPKDEPEPHPPKEEEKEEPPVEEKKKLGPPPKVKVDVFSMDPQTMRELLDIQMKLKRRGRGSLSDDEDDGPPPPSLASLVEPTNRMLKQSEWLRGRIALSRRAARFELPMDVGELAEMSPVEYLSKYCIISQRRRALYKKAFNRADRDNDGRINRKELETAVLDALVDTIQADKVSQVLEFIRAEHKPVYTSRFFAAFCALLERLYYKEFAKEDSSERKEEKEKEILEEADFTGLDWKLQGQYVNPALKELLYKL